MDVCTYDSLGNWRVCPPLINTLRKRTIITTKQNNMCHLEAMYIKVTKKHEIKVY
jgi:hypothetical protein